MSNITHLDKSIIHQLVERTNFASIIKRTTSSSREEFIYACMRVCDFKFDRAFRNEINKRNYEI